MTIFDIILLTAGFGLLFLGACSGYALLSRALKLPDRLGDETNIATLWALFVLGISSGLLLTWLALP